MTPGDSFTSRDWDSIKLVAFDVDGTLYNQAPLRWRMVRDMCLQAVASFSLATPTVIRHYRQLREELGDKETRGFERELIAVTAAKAHCPETLVRKLVEEWINLRPLPYLAACRYPGVDRLFDALHRSGKTVGVVSDYPAMAKLAAMHLHADIVISATDLNIGVLKPNPKGLVELMRQASVAPECTLFIGDRIDRDGFAAQRAGVRCLIRASRPHAGFQTFRAYDDAIFAPLLRQV